MTDWLDDAISREGARLFAPHPTSEDLVQFVDAPDGADAAANAALEDHLRICPSCAQDVATLRAAAEELSPTGSSTAGGSSERDESHGTPADPVRPRHSGLSRWLSPSFWVPVTAIAATVVLLVVLPPRDDASGHRLLQPVGAPIVLSSEVERGGPSTLAAVAGQPLAVTFELPGDGDGPIRSADLVLRGAAGEVIGEIDGAAAIDAHGTFVVLLDAGILATGRYELVARDRLGERVFVLEVTSRGPTP
jgi:hypothetical protein